MAQQPFGTDEQMAKARAWFHDDGGLGIGRKVGRASIRMEMLRSVLSMPLGSRTWLHGKRRHAEATRGFLPASVEAKRHGQPDTRDW